jgi:thiamine-monophosphate kinase
MPMTVNHLPLGPGAEFDAVRSTIARWGSIARGTGDDAALLDVPPGRRLVVSTDTTVENVHFRRAWLSAEEIGYRAGAAAVSDLAAMGATPLAMVVSLTLPDSWRPETMEIADGIATVARDTETPIVGGDLTSGSELSIGITVLGTVERALTRAGARPGDTLWVTGRLGGPGRALQAWEQQREPLPVHRARFVHPSPRLREARWLGAHGANAAIDISDGLASDAAHVAAASRMRLTIDLGRIPCLDGTPPAAAARSGEEYELLVSAPATLDTAEFEREFGLPITAVGSVARPGTGGEGLDVLLNGERVELPKGYDHFSH